MTGIVRNNPDGIFATTERENDWIKWVAVRGEIDDWAIYYGWAEQWDVAIYDFGTKLTNINTVRELVPCTDEVLKRYRF